MREKNKKTKQGKLERKRVGDYEYLEHPKGGATIYGPGIRDRGFYVPPDEKIREKHQKEREAGNAQSMTLKIYLRHRGILHRGRRSAVDGKKALGLPTGNSHIKKVTPYEIWLAIHRAYPARKVARFLRYGDVSLPLISKFQRTRSRIYDSIVKSRWKGKEGFRGYLEHEYPGLYAALAKRASAETIDLSELGSMLRQEMDIGSVSMSTLAKHPNPQRRKLARKVMYLVRNGTLQPQLGKEYKYLDVVSYLTGVKKQEISQVTRGRQECTQIAEKLTECFLVWSLATTYHPLKTIEPLEELHTNGGEVIFWYSKGDEKKKGHADARYGDTAVEIKTGAGYFNKSRLLELLNKYTPGKSSWDDGALIDRSVVFFHCDRKFYRHALPKLQEAKITVVDYRTFHDALEKLVTHIERGGYGSYLSEVAPRISDISCLLGIHEAVSYEHLLQVTTRPYLADMRRYSLDMLSSLTEQGWNRYYGA